MPMVVIVMTIFICGDSTAASYTQDRAPMTGWGQILPEYTHGIPVRNHAMAGRSSKSFLYEGRLQKIESEIQPGDLLLIQFTHNDMSPLPWRHTDPWTGFMNCLSVYADTALLHDARPVLMTPICQRLWQDGVFAESLGEYREAIRVLAGLRGLPLIDMYSGSSAIVRSLGEEGSKALYMHVKKGLFPAYPEGSRDDTHTQRAGADAFARFAADELSRLCLLG